jgi:hypothetical protein
MTLPIGTYSETFKTLSPPGIVKSYTICVEGMQLFKHNAFGYIFLLFMQPKVSNYNMYHT